MSFPLTSALRRLLRRTAAAATALPLCLAIGLPTVAKADEAPAEETMGIFGIQVENDLFGSDNDRHYTHGLRLSWFTAEGKVPEWTRTGASYVPFFSKEGELRIGYEFAQTFFTPDDITVEDVQPDQRPYAGWVYGGVSLIADTGTQVDALSLQVGVIGPSSLAEQEQTFWHRLIGSPRPRGWEHQLKNEPGVVLGYERQWRSAVGFPLDNFSVDVTPSVGGAVGNVYTYGAVGAMLRFGHDLPADYGPPRIRPSLQGSDYFIPIDHFGWYLFAGVEGRGIARNIFLDGNTFANSYSVDKKPFVGDFQFGAAVIYGRYRLSYTQVFRTAEYYGQGATDSFGSINLSVQF